MAGCLLSYIWPLVNLDMISLRATIMNGSFLELHYQSGNGRNASPKSRLYFCPPSRQNPGHPQMKPPITHKSPPAMRSAHSNHPQMMTAHHNKKGAQLHMKNKELPSLAPTNNSTKWAQMMTLPTYSNHPQTTTALHDMKQGWPPTNDNNCMPSKPMNDEECPPQPLMNNNCPSHKACTTTHEWPSNNMEHPPQSPTLGCMLCTPVTIPLTFWSLQGCMAVSIDTCTALVRFIGHVDTECNHTLLKMRILAFLPISPCSST